LNEGNIDLLHSSNTSEEFLLYMTISTKLMNKLIKYIEYAENQQNMVMNYLNNESDYKTNECDKKITENEIYNNNIISDENNL